MRTIFFLLCQRLSSTTTRIKTELKPSTTVSLSVRDYLPLQQGLRPYVGHLKPALTGVRDYLPLQQGLRPRRPSS